MGGLTIDVVFRTKNSVSYSEHYEQLRLSLSTASHSKIASVIRLGEAQVSGYKYKYLEGSFTAWSFSQVMTADSILRPMGSIAIGL